jgi:diaminohydroxyphosphoribosylaminopyrimidine deaminase/5-amino-6-(5-phosphoribosylamino)uracil reductase
MSPRPRVTLKLATSLDGRIATASGESRWITGEESRNAVHAMRADQDAILVGINTVLADDPELTVRLASYAGPQPLRVVLDSRQRLPETSKLASTARETATLVLSATPPKPELEALGVRVVQVKADAGRPDLGHALDQLVREGVENLMIEGGGEVAGAFLEADLVDAIEWFRAPILLGAEGRPAVGPLALASLAAAPRFSRVAVEALGADLRERYEKA